MALLVCLFLLGCAASLHIDSGVRMPVDDFGRTRIFHGVNVVSKLAPYLPNFTGFDPEMSLSEEDISYMKSWGFNLVRLGVIWEAVEPSPGVYNTTYLHLMNSLVTRLGQAGIYTMIDSHQDLLTRALCGEGMPSYYAGELEHECRAHVLSAFFWLIGMCRSIQGYHMDVDANGNPLISECLTHSFYKMYLSPEANSLFAKLYTNTEDLQDKFLAYWDAVHSVFYTNPYVLGYDLLNEPWPGNFYASPTYLLPGRVDKEVLQPMYTRIADEMRNRSANATMLFEPVQFGDVMSLFGGISFSVGFTSPPGSSNQPNSLLNDHSYCCEMSYDACKTGEPTLKDALSDCASFNRRKVLKRKEDADRLGVGLIISEFGACFDTDACAAEVTSVTSACDEVLASWAYWQYKGFKDFTTFTAALSTGEGLFYPNSTVQNTKVKALARTYAYATQGVPVHMYFNPKTSAFAFMYLANTTIAAPTEIYYSSEYYYDGPMRVMAKCTHLSGCNPSISFAVPNVISVQFGKTSSVQDGSLVSLLVTPDVTGEVGSFPCTFAQIAYDVVDSHLLYPGQVVLMLNFQDILTGSYSLTVLSAEYGEICFIDVGTPTSSFESHYCFLNSVQLAYDYEIQLRQKHFFRDQKVDVTVQNLNDNTLTIVVSPK